MGEEGSIWVNEKEVVIKYQEPVVWNWNKIEQTTYTEWDIAEDTDIKQYVHEEEFQLQTPQDEDGLHARNFLHQRVQDKLTEVEL